MERNYEAIAACFHNDCGCQHAADRGGVRELHWHKQAESAYMILGKARITSVTTVDAEGRNMIADVP